MTAGLHATDIAGVVYAGDLAAVPGPAERTWSVYRAGMPVVVLEQHRIGGPGWVAGRIRDDVAGDLVAEGPTALSVLRRLATRRELAAAASPARR